MSDYKNEIDEIQKIEKIEKKELSWTIVNTFLLFLFFIVILIFIFYFIRYQTFQYEKLPDWKKKHPYLQYSNFNNIQKIYYKIFLKVISDDAPDMSYEEIDLLASLLVTSSKHIPYFAAIVYTESFLPGYWIGKRYVPPKRWHNFTILDDGGSPSYGRVKMKFSSIVTICKYLKEPVPNSIKDIDINSIEGEIKLFRLAGKYFDMLTEKYGRIGAISAYKMGTPKYNQFKNNNNTLEPYQIIGHTLVKANEYLEYFGIYCIRGENDFKWK